jgi:hypothetical protein
MCNLNWKSRYILPKLQHGGSHARRQEIRNLKATQTLTKQHVSSPRYFRGVELSEIFITKSKFIAKETTQCHKTPRILETSVFFFINKAFYVLYVITV